MIVATTIKEWSIIIGIFTSLVIGGISYGGLKTEVKEVKVDVKEVKQEVKEKRQVDLQQSILLKEVAVQTKYLAEAVKDLSK